MKILLTLCARKGSKGVFDKNIRALLGKPLIAHSIEQALAWGRAERIIVSTDSEEIAGIAREYGAEIPFLRPESLAQDMTPKVETLRHALRECERVYSSRFDVIVDLDVTAPLRKAGDIENCYQLFLSRNPDTLYSVVPSRRNPYFNMVEVGQDGYAKLCKALPQATTRRQDAPAVYDMNASIYFYQRAFLMNPANKSPISSQGIVYVMEDWCGFDIDHELDFKWIEFLMKEKLYHHEKAI